MRQKPNERAQRGFTLTEVLVGIAIFAIIFVAALMIYDRSNRVFKSSMEASDLQQGTRVAFEKLVAEIRMAGFDYDRDGIPSGSDVYQQPDEQLEYIHPHAITFRTNLDYETDAANANGAEPDYKPAGGEFPIVTTGNDEIITYALVSEDDSANSDSITFYADIAKPRATFPGGSSETLVTIDDVDLCDDGGGCENPPYTLTRFTLDDAGDVVSVPVASNIRRMDLTYFSDALSQTEISPTDVWGLGQYTVDSSGSTTTAATTAIRGTRGGVQSIRLTLVGMTENPDINYESPIEAALDSAEQVDTASQYRQYALESMIVPRNLGRRGLEEFTTTPPGAPHITWTCAEGCGVIYLQWKAPDYGTVNNYTVRFGTDGVTFPGTFAGTGNTFAYIPELDPNETYYFRVIAENSYGSEWSDNTSPGVQPINYTTPDEPVFTSATNITDGTALENDIYLEMQTPATNVGTPANSCGFGAEDVNSFYENKQFEVRRSPTPFDDSDPTGNPIENQGRLVFDGIATSAGDPSLDPGTGEVTWTDNTGLINCETYYYRARIKELCAASAALNDSGDVSSAFSDWSEEISGSSTAAAAPATPTNLAIDATSTCLSGSCTVNLKWDRVTQDANGKNIRVDTYLLKRVFFDFSANAENPSEPGLEETIITVTDSDPFDTGNQMTYTDTPPDPTTISSDPADRWHYYLAARQCTTLDSPYTTPEVKFPCTVLALTGASPTTIDGSGLSVDSPLLFDTTIASNATFDMSSSKDIGSVSIDIWEGDTTTTVSGGTAAALTTTTAQYSVPLDTTTVYRVEMTVIDTTGCGSTITRYVQGSATSCCLLPYKDAGGTVFDSTVLQLVAPGGGGKDDEIFVRLKNQCDDTLTLNRFRVQWNTANNAFGASLLSVTYPDGTVQLVGGTGGATTVVVPDAVAETIAGGATYQIKLTFSASNGSLVDLTNFCAEYDSASGTGIFCKIAQSADVCTIP